jgi:glycolate oxidase FAD binding subunit
VTPASSQEVAAVLRDASARGERVNVSGSGTKAGMGSPAQPAGVRLSTAALRRILVYEPKDLTLSVEPGLPWAELTALLAAEKQMLPLDPPFAAQATVGGVVLTNCSGPRRRQYGAARDMVIGMTYATMDGALAESGGMVVKNVAGLDVQKALIGSFGTLALVTVINFKLAPLPEATRTFVLSFATARELTGTRDRLLSGALQPSAIDAISPAAAALFGLDGWCLAIRASGGASVIARYQQELAGAQIFEGDSETRFWRGIEEFPASQPYLVRAGHPLSALEAVLSSSRGPTVSRAGTGVTYLAFPDRGALLAWWNNAACAAWARVVDASPGDLDEYWASPGPELDWMKKLKAAFDPNNLLNRGRLYGRV